jgi:hypothetical protein
MGHLPFLKRTLFCEFSSVRSFTEKNSCEPNNIRNLQVHQPILKRISQNGHRTTNRYTNATGHNIRHEKLVTETTTDNTAKPSKQNKHHCFLTQKNVTDTPASSHLLLPSPARARVHPSSAFLGPSRSRQPHPGSCRRRRAAGMASSCA